MRTALLIVGTMLVIACLFFVYVWFQPSTAQRIAVVNRPSTAPAVAPTTQFGQAGPMGAGPGQDVSFQMYDKRGELSSEFRAAHFDPQPGNVVLVDKPQSDFYLGGGQVLRINGASGEVVVPDNGGRSGGHAMQGPPSRGKLSDVIIRLFPSAGAAEPTLTCKVNNASFDNDTFRIVTESFIDKEGKKIEADQVPVEVRGVDYDFDGNGLVIRWNERDRKLQLLEIAHGKRLVIKNPSAFSGLTRTDAPPQFDPSLMLASADPASAAEVMKPAKTAAPATHPTSRAVGAVSSSPYRAVFLDNVRITQGDKQVATADVMNSDFLMSSNSSTTQPTTQSSDPTTKSQAKSGAKRPNAPAKTAKRAPSSSPTASEPITVFWTGKLRVTPAPDNVLIDTPGEMNIEMVGKSAPVALDWQDTNIRCASFAYRSADQFLTVRNSPQYPRVTIADGQGTNIESQGFTYSAEDGQTVMNGAGVADMQTVADSSDPNAAPQKLHAAWSKSCVLVMPGNARQGAMTIESAKLEGDVSVDHPQMKLKAQSLDLAFAPAAPNDAPTTQQSKQKLALKGLEAHQDVRCTFVATDGSTDVQSDSLFVTMMPLADGTFIPQQMIADGHVKTHDDKENLSAGRLEIGLGPAPATTQPTDAPASKTQMGKFQVNSLFAQQDVHFKTHDGVTADADQLDIEDFSGLTRVTLSKQPFATVASGDNSLTGALIKLDPGTHTTEVVGPGTMSAVRQDNPDSRPTPIHVEWKTGLLADTSQNRIDVTGSVQMTSQSDEKSTSSASSDRLTMALADKPTTYPTAKPAKAKSAIAGSDMLGGKAIRTITLSDDVKVNSVQLAQDDSLLRRAYLKAPTMRYEMMDAAGGKGSDQLARVVIPAAGQMLFDDRRPTTQPADQTTTQPASDALLGGMHGATAFSWDDNLTYEAATMQAIMNGGVRIVHQSDDTSATTFHLDGDKVTADFEADPTTQPSATTKPSDAIGGMAGGVHPKRLHAEGNVRFTSDKVQFEAAELIYLPQEQILIGRGNDSQPAIMLDAQGSSQGTFKEIVYNMKTDQLRLREFHALVRR